ncbi:hypothetical protein C6T59_31465 [Burkholderia multivorans]|nr:hypothetical protein [Burkholderia multivorans]MDR8824997.1 hypothetical protein [Burkholderia multivorans]PRF14945.1 hypothetical protein C6Q01_03625 [Burkholderia multivorans]PRF93239.1 hypothetical protein C6Q23_05910 [Burkholderia multivorans]PRG58576.1 hypothetical protein C6T59_31465 [Burkholderia multivorans]
MGTSPIDSSAVAMVGEQVAAAVEEAAQNDPRSCGLSDAEPVDALRALSAALSASDDLARTVSTVLARPHFGVNVLAVATVDCTSSL